MTPFVPVILLPGAHGVQTTTVAVCTLGSVASLGAFC